MFTDPPRPQPAASPRGSSRHAVLRHTQAEVARERQSAYRADDGQPSPRAAADDGETQVEAPFGPPVLAEVPEFASVLHALSTADKILLDAVLSLARLVKDGSVEAATGVGVEQWLAAIARMAGLDRRLVLRMCRLLERLPTLAAGAADRKVSFTQLRALTLGLHGAPLAVDAPLDAWLASAIDELPDDADPDVLVRQAAKAVDELAPELLDDQADDIARYSRSLMIQPNLLGTGGTFYGTEDAIGLAVLDAATAPRRDQLDDVGRARADNLQRRLRHECGDERPQAPLEAWTGGEETGAITGEDARDAGTDRADPDVAVPVETLAAPKLLLRWEFDALMDRTAAPADVLTRLVGGKLRLTSEHAARLIEARGADVRSIIVDGGKVIGVGRASRVPREWLRDTVLALHDTCTEPLCDRPATAADIDHAIDWSPPRDDGTGGRTDLDNLGPLCGKPNRDKRASGWRVSQTIRGTRTWQHPRSGLSITTIPRTWRPSGAPPRPRKRRQGTQPPARGDDPPRSPADGPPGSPSDRAPRRQAHDDGPLPF